jgi:hypothetical protein
LTTTIEVTLMQAEFVGRMVMRYMDQDLQYETEHADLAAADDQERGRRKQYRRKRLVRSTRRIPKASTSHPGPGISGRRNRRWSW